MSSTAAYLFLSNDDKIPGSPSEKAILGLQLLSSIAGAPNIPHAYNLSPAFDIEVLPLSRSLGLLTAFLFSTSPEEVDLSSNFDIDVKKLTLNGHSDAIALRLDYGPVKTSQVAYADLPVIPEINPMAVMVGNTKIGTMTSKGYYTRIGTGLPLTPQDICTNFISTVDYLGFYAVSKFHSKYSHSFTSEGTRLSNKLAADYFPVSVRDKILKDAGGTSIEYQEPWVTRDIQSSTNSADDNFLSEMPSTVTPGETDPAYIQTRGLKFATGPAVPTKSKPRMSFSVPIFENISQTAINTWHTIPTEHYLKIEIASPSHIFRLQPGICLSFDTTFEPVSNQTTVYQPLRGPANKSVGTIMTTAVPILLAQ